MCDRVGGHIALLGTNQRTESGRNLPKKKIIITANVPVRSRGDPLDIGDLYDMLFTFMRCDFDGLDMFDRGSWHWSTKLRGLLKG